MLHSLPLIGYTGITMNDCILRMNIYHLSKQKICTIVHKSFQVMLPTSSNLVSDKTRTVQLDLKQFAKTDVEMLYDMSVGRLRCVIVSYRQICKQF